ncbi:MAG: glycosyltransferase family 2 protein, partial [Asticcacaulis sp.]
YNVTEDADLGFRLARHGYDMDLIHLPTFETPPDTLRSWLPQRCRWIKGYMQTLLVHSRTPRRLSPAITGALLLSLGLGTLSAICYAPFMALLLARSLLSLLQPGAVLMNWPDLLLLCLSLTAAQLSLAIGARRANLPLSLNDRLMAPVYWALQSLAAIFACHQLLVKPFHWDKTDHSPMATAPR